MELTEIINKYWSEIAEQNWNNLLGYFKKDAIINWHNTNECFTVKEFVDCNNKYPGKWNITLERVINLGTSIISAVKVYNSEMSFHAVSFFEFNGDKICLLDEYWGEDGEVPEWRRDIKIGKPIV